MIAAAIRFGESVTFNIERNRERKGSITQYKSMPVLWDLLWTSVLERPVCVDDADKVDSTLRKPAEITSSRRSFTSCSTWGRLTIGIQEMK